MRVTSVQGLLTQLPAMTTDTLQQFTYQISCISDICITIHEGGKINYDVATKKFDGWGSLQREEPC